MQPDSKWSSAGWGSQQREIITPTGAKGLHVGKHARLKTIVITLQGTENVERIAKYIMERRVTFLEARGSPMRVRSCTDEQRCNTVTMLCKWRVFTLSCSVRHLPVIQSSHDRFIMMWEFKTRRRWWVRRWSSMSANASTEQTNVDRAVVRVKCSRFDREVAWDPYARIDVVQL